MRVTLKCTNSERRSAYGSIAIARSYLVKTGYSRPLSLLKVIGNYTCHCCNVQQLFINFYIIKRFITQTVYTRSTRINYKIVPVTNFNKYVLYGTSEMNNMYINIGVISDSEKGTEKTPRLLVSQLKQYMVRMFMCYGRCLVSFTPRWN